MFLLEIDISPNKVGIFKDNIHVVYLKPTQAIKI